MGESGTGRRLRHGVPTSSLRLVPSLSSLGEAVASQSRPSTCTHDPEPSLLGLWLGFLPLCRVPISSASASSMVPQQPFRAGLASWSHEVPGHAMTSARQRAFPVPLLTSQMVASLLTSITLPCHCEALRQECPLPGAKNTRSFILVCTQLYWLIFNVKD